MNPWIQVTGWTLIHFVWQGAVLAVVTAAALRFSGRRSAPARYAIACVGLLGMLAAPVATAAYLTVSWRALPESSATALVAPLTVTGVAIEQSDRALAAGDRGHDPAIPIDAMLPAVVWTWLVGVTLLLARLSAGCWRIRRLQAVCAAAPASRWQPLTEQLASRLGVRVGFRVVESGLVRTPAVLGWVRPVILLPVAALANLTPGQIEALLAHELAHIRRRDYAVNLCQTAAEALLFFHPGVWWVSARVREAREHCCDDAAVGMCGEPLAYAEALAALAAWRTAPLTPALGAADGLLLGRVRRVLQADEKEEPAASHALVIVAAAIALVLGASLLSPWSQPARAATPAGTVAPLQPRSEDRRVRTTDRFVIDYEPDLDLHAERFAREAERSYERVSGDLRHNLASRVPVRLFRTTAALESSVQSGEGQRHLRSFAEGGRDRILFAIDHPPDQWFGLITHELTHVFSFDILPGTSTPAWITEGLAEYERGSWDPGDLAALRELVRANAVPSLSAAQAVQGSGEPRTLYALGHAAFDFIEARWGKAGVRQFLFALRRAALGGGDPYAAAFKGTGAEFGKAFEQYLAERFARAADQAPDARFDFARRLSIEGVATALRSPVPAGLACLEVWVSLESENRQRWGVECGDDAMRELLPSLKPGDRLIVTGSPAREPDTQRILVHGVERRSDGFRWESQAQPRAPDTGS